MNEELQKITARALDAKLELLPFLPELLSDLWALGSYPDLITAMLRSQNLLAATTRVLDLGCGKGAVSITLARELGYRVLGIDSFEPFVEDAKTKAREHVVSDLCSFECGDLRDRLKQSGDYDVVIYASVGQVLGSMETCVAALCRAVKPGGFMLIDDCYLADAESTERNGYENLGSHAQTLRRLGACNDDLIEEIIIPDRDVRAMNRAYIECIGKRAQGLARRYPDKADIFRWYVENQKSESMFIETHLKSAIWLVRRCA